MVKCFFLQLLFSGLSIFSFILSWNNFLLFNIISLEEPCIHNYKKAPIKILYVCVRNVFEQNTMYLNHCFAFDLVYQSNQQKNIFSILLFVQGKHKIRHGLVKYISINISPFRITSRKAGGQAIVGWCIDILKQRGVEDHRCWVTCRTEGEEINIKLRN